jgi:hypothetical protein
MAYQSHHCSSTLLCSSCISVFLSPSSRFLFFCILCSVCHVNSMHYASACSSLRHCSTLQVVHCVSSVRGLTDQRINFLFSVLHLFHTPSPLHDHHGNSSSSLVVILNAFIISGRFPEILWLLWQSQLFIFSVSYSQSSLASLASKPLPSRDHRW